MNRRRFLCVRRVSAVLQRVTKRGDATHAEAPGPGTGAPASGPAANPSPATRAAAPEAGTPVRFMAAMRGPGTVETTHEPPLVGSPGFSRLGDAQPAKAGTTNAVPIRFMAATHVRGLEVFPFHDP
jgi:hypothetical protein